jgi:hypothetical protein
MPGGGLIRTRLNAIQVTTDLKVAHSSGDSNANARRTIAARVGTQDRRGLAHRPAPWPVLIRKRSVVQVHVAPPISPSSGSTRPGLFLLITRHPGCFVPAACPVTRRDRLGFSEARARSGRRSAPWRCPGDRHVARSSVLRLLLGLGGVRLAWLGGFGPGWRSTWLLGAGGLGGFGGGLGGGLGVRGCGGFFEEPVPGTQGPGE